MSKFVTSIKGNFPLVISVPHGGRMKPKKFPDRRNGVHGEDHDTIQLSKSLKKELAYFKIKPYFVILELSRDKLDVNRPRSEAYENDKAKAVWEEYHLYLQKYINDCLLKHGRCFLIDLHGQNHPEKRIEIGYCLDKNELYLLKGSNAYRKSSIIHSGDLSQGRELIFGADSFGEILTKKGYGATPRLGVTPKVNEKFFSGGYITKTYCFKSNVIGFQIEVNLEGIRDSKKNIKTFSKVFAESIVEYFEKMKFSRKL